jgi:hypothetical protein
MRIAASVQSFFKLAIILVLSVSQAAYAVMIEPQPVQEPGAVVAQGEQSQLERDRAKVREFVERANVKERLQALGVNGLNAGSRVDAMTPEEVHAMAQRIDGMPAGAALSQNDWILILLVAVLLIVAL